MNGPPDPAPLIDIRQDGERTIARMFCSGALMDEVMLAVQEHLNRALEAHSSRELVFDLAEIRICSSTLLGMMVAATKQVPTVALINVDPNVLAYLRVTRLDELFRIS